MTNFVQVTSHSNNILTDRVDEDFELNYNSVMKKIFYLLSLIILLALPAYSVDSKPNVLQEDAKEDIKQDLKEQVKLYYNTNNIDQCVEALAKIPDTEKSAEEWLLMANIAQDRKKELDAIFYLQRAILTDPKYFKSYYNLGNYYFANDNMNLAMQNYRKAIKLNEKFAYAYYNLGCCYLKKKNYRLARYYTGMAIKNYADEPLFYYNAAYTYKMLKNEKRAAEALEFYEDLMSR